MIDTHIIGSQPKHGKYVIGDPVSMIRSNSCPPASVMINENSCPSLRRSQDGHRRRSGIASALDNRRFHPPPPHPLRVNGARPRFPLQPSTLGFLTSDPSPSVHALTRHAFACTVARPPRRPRAHSRIVSPSRIARIAVAHALSISATSCESQSETRDREIRGSE